MLVQLGTVQFNVVSDVHRTTVRSDTIRLTGTFCPEIAGHVVAQRLDALQLMMKQGDPQLLISLDGRSQGYWVIEGVESYVSGSEDASQQQQFNMKLRRYGERPPGVESIN